MTDEADILPAERIPSGIPGLDRILLGGFLSGGVYIVQGASGTGKTILANQVCFRHAEQGGKALYVTLLAESHARLLRSLAALRFYDPAAVPQHVYYISALHTLEAGGPAALLDQIRRELLRQGATLLVVDGLLLPSDEASGSDQALRKFIHGLQDHVAGPGRLALLLDGGLRPNRHVGAHAIADGAIALHDTHRGEDTQRTLEVLKSRGSACLGGVHPFRITDNGIVAYPRIEAMRQQPSDEDTGSSGRLSVGVPTLDEMLGGGLPAGTTTLLLGASGAGKTVLGTHFLSRSSPEEPGLHFGFYEMPERLVQNAATLGLDLAEAAGRGVLEMIWKPTTGQILDDLGGQLLEAVRRRKVKRLFVDGLGGYVEAADAPARAGRVFTALVNELRTMGVTTVYTAETPNLVGPEVVVPVPGVSVVVDNMVLMRFAEYRARLHRLFSIIKVRGSSFDPAMREFRITDRGIALADTFATAESILSGFGTERESRGSAVKPGVNPTRTPSPRRRGG